MVLSAFLLMFSVVLGVISETFVLDAHPGTKVSQWRYPELEPFRARMIRGVAAGLAIMGSVDLSNIMGYWSVGLVVAVMAVPCVLRMRHNRSVGTVQ